MKKVLPIFLALVVGLCLAGLPAQAVTLQAGNFEAHLIDASSLYVDGVPRAPLDLDPDPWISPELPGLPGPAPWADTSVQVDDEVRVVANIDTWDPPAQLFQGDDFGHLTSLLYDLDVIKWVTAFDVNEPTLLVTQMWFGPGTRNPVTSLIPAHNPAGSGGVIELWLDSTPEHGPNSGLADARNDAETLFDPNGTPGSPGTPGGDAPFLWAEAGALGVGALGHLVAPDGYPTVNSIAWGADDSSLWLQGMLAPIGNVLVGAPGQQVLTPYLWKETVYIDTADPTNNYGSVTQARVTLTGRGSAFPLFDLGDDGTDVLISANLRLPPNPEYVGTSQDYGNWAVASWDPASGAIIPEPASLTLLGLSLFGLVGGLIRRRRS